MRSNAKRTYAALALLVSGSTPWACESRGVVDDSPGTISRPVTQRLTTGNDDAAVLFEPWYETCGDLAGDGESRRTSSAGAKSSKPPGAAGTVAIPPTAAYGWLAIRYTRGKSCGSAKVHFDGRFVETLELYADVSAQCERLYYLQDHSAKEHRFEVLLEHRSGSSTDGYACLDNVVAGW